MKQKIFKFILIATVLIANSNYSYSQNIICTKPVEQETARSIVQQDLIKLLEMIDSEDIESYGLSLEDDIRKITLGTPLYMGQLKQGLNSNSSKYNLVVTTILVPLKLDNSPRCFAILGEENGKWAPIGIGGAQWLSDNAKLINEGYTELMHDYYIVQFPTLNEKYLMTSADGQNYRIMGNDAEQNLQDITSDDLVQKFIMDQNSLQTIKN